MHRWFLCLQETEQILGCRQEAKRLIEFVTNKKIPSEIGPDDCDKIKSMALNMAKENITFSRLIGKKAFWKDEFLVNKYTLEPRPETEGLIEIAAQLFHNGNPKNILDIGTGSGCILISLLREFPMSYGIGTDIEPNAIKIAIQNSETVNVQHRSKFICTNWTKGINAKFDLIVSNPPYIPEKTNLPANVLNQDPRKALFSGKDGLDSYREIIPATALLLSHNGIAIFEIGEDQGPALMQIASKYFRTVQIQKDLCERDRYIVMAMSDTLSSQLKTKPI